METGVVLPRKKFKSFFLVYICCTIVTDVLSCAPNTTPVSILVTFKLKIITNNKITIPKLPENVIWWGYFSTGRRRYRPPVFTSISRMLDNVRIINTWTYRWYGTISLRYCVCLLYYAYIQSWLSSVTLNLNMIELIAPHPYPCLTHGHTSTIFVYYA